MTAAPVPGPTTQEALIQSEEQRLQLARALIDFQVGVPAERQRDGIGSQ